MPLGAHVLGSLGISLPLTLSLSHIQSPWVHPVFRWTTSSFSCCPRNCSSLAVTSASNPTAHLIDAGALESMIARPRGALVDDVGRGPPQGGPLPLEAEIAHPRDVLIAVAKVVREEQRQALDLAEEGALDGDVLDVGGLGELEGLGGLGLLGRGEVEVVAVEEQTEGLGRAGGGRGAQEEGVELYLGGKPEKGKEKSSRLV